MTKLRSFYVPHERVQYTGELYDENTGEYFIPERRVKQSFKDECDINNIIKSYSQTGQIRHINAKAAQGTYEDLPEPMDLQEALNTVRDANTAFASLPSQVRDRFQNDPGQFLAFMQDPANQDEMIRLGLATRRPESGGGNGGTPPPPAPPPAPPAAPPPAAEPPKPT